MPYKVDSWEVGRLRTFKKKKDAINYARRHNRKYPGDAWIGKIKKRR